MTRAQQILNQAAFISQIMGALIELGKQLFVRTDGSVPAAIAEIRRIPDYWANQSQVDKEVDEEMEELRKQGL